MLPLLDASQDQGHPEHQGTTPGLKETLLGTLHWMRRQALRRRPGRCPAQFLISFQVEKSTQNPLSAQEQIMAPAGQVHPWPHLLRPGASDARPGLGRLDRGAQPEGHRGYQLSPSATTAIRETLQGSTSSPRHPRSSRTVSLGPLSAKNKKAPRATQFPAALSLLCVLLIKNIKVAILQHEWK